MVFEGSEKAIERDVINAAETLGFAVSKTSQPQRPVGMTVGIPDLYMAHPRWRLRLWVECKGPGNTPTEAQRAWHDTEREAGGNVCVVTSVADLIENLKAMGAPLDERSGAA